MYSVVLVTMLATGEATPSWGWGCHGCHGCYSCYGCWGGCHSWSYGCHGCWGCSYGCSCSWYGCSSYSCHGCCGGVVIGYSPYGVYHSPQTPQPPKPKESEKEKKKKDNEEVSSVIVDLADGAALYVDGQRMPMSGSQSFNTPSLEIGKDYYYTMKAVATQNGQTVSQTKRVNVRAGETTRVAFNELKPEAGATARVTVKLPADARLTVNDQPTTLTSAVRSFNTPSLEAGKDYFYTMKAEIVRDGKTLTETQKITVAAGKDINVEFKKLDAVQTAGR